jgi:outer membrane protein insertion porin family
MTKSRLSRLASPFGIHRSLSSLMISSSTLSTSVLAASLRAITPATIFRPLLIASAVAGSFAWTGAQAFEPFVVRDIRVEGIQRTDAGTVFNYLPVKAGETFTDEKATAALKALYATGFFKDVRIDVDKDVLVVIVEERPAIASVDFTGMKEFDKDTLKKALRDIGLYETAIFDRSALDRAEQELKRQYLSRGKYGAVITTTVTPLERNRASITFNIDEGDVATIKQIHIVGNQVYKEKDLLAEIALTTPGWFTWYSKADQYSKQKLTGDIESLRSFYLNRGYLEFNVESTQVSITPDKKDIYITINITEGEKYTVSDVKIAGEALVTEEELRKLLFIKAGDTYSGEKLTASTKAIQDRLGALGYAFANANPQPELDRAKHTVALTMFVDPGRRVYVRRINVTGNTKTRDEVVRREMRQAESGWYDVDAIKLSKERLERLSYFKEVNVETPQVSGTNDQVDVNIAVTEKPTGTFNIGAGYSALDKVILTTSVQQANLFGSGQNVGLSLDTSSLTRTAVLSATDPYFTDNGVSRTVDLFYRTTNPSDTNLGDFSIQTAGAGLSFGVPFTEYDTVFFGLTFEHTHLDVFATSPQIYQDYVAQFGPSTTALINTIGWQRDSRDSGITPTRGRFQRANLGVAVPGGSLRYYQATYQQTYYYPISQNYTLSANGEFDYARGYDGKPLPVFKNYYAGGIGSVRGYDTSSIGPRDINGDPIGGAKRFNVNLELLFPLPGTGRDKAFRGFVFADAGGVFAEKVKITAGPKTETTMISASTTDANGITTTTLVPQSRLISSGIKYSVGFGINWLSPLGALRLSYAIPLHTTPDDKLQRLQFNIGNGF